MKYQLRNRQVEQAYVKAVQAMMTSGKGRADHEPLEIAVEADFASGA